MVARAVDAEAGKWMRELLLRKGGWPIITNAFEICYNVHFCPKVQAAIISIKQEKKSSQLIMADEGLKAGLFSISYKRVLGGFGLPE